MNENITVPSKDDIPVEVSEWAPCTDPVDTGYIGPGRAPIVSIILPAYNAHNTIKKTICSIAMQEGSEDIEIIIADDCSKYPYDHIAEQFAHMIRIRVVRMLKNGGPGAARQVGYDHSYGQYIMWMDADDTLVAADTIKTLVNVMEQQHMDCVYGKFLEENENGSIYPHEIHMVWMFGKLYRRSFLEKYNIRFNTSLSNEDTGFNCVVKGCTDKIWYIPKDVYIWHFKANSITRIKNSMYGADSGYKGWADNMAWQILELQKRFVNRNYILSEIIGNMVTCYCFHEENLRNYPMNADISLNWCRGFYQTVYKPNEKYITQAMFDQLAAQCLASHNISAKGIIPSMSLKQFMREMRKPIVHAENEETCGATPAGYVPPITSKDWPVEIHDYYDRMEAPLQVDSDTNHSRYGGMKKAIGLETSDEDYDMEYDGSQPLEEKKETEETTKADKVKFGSIYETVGDPVGVDGYGSIVTTDKYKILSNDKCFRMDTPNLVMTIDGIYKHLLTSLVRAAKYAASDSTIYFPNYSNYNTITGNFYLADENSTDWDSMKELTAEQAEEILPSILSSAETPKSSVYDDTDPMEINLGNPIAMINEYGNIKTDKGYLISSLDMCVSHEDPRFKNPNKSLHCRGAYEVVLNQLLEQAVLTFDLNTVIFPGMYAYDIKEGKFRKMHPTTIDTIPLKGRGSAIDAILKRILGKTSEIDNLEFLIRGVRGGEDKAEPRSYDMSTNGVAHINQAFYEKYKSGLCDSHMTETPEAVECPTGECGCSCRSFEEESIIGANVPTRKVGGTFNKPFTP